MMYYCVSGTSTSEHELRELGKLVVKLLDFK
jgi:hypothetical protein